MASRRAAWSAEDRSPLKVTSLIGERIMPRARPLFPIALSLESAAKAIKTPVRVLRQAIYQRGELPAYRGPNNSTRVIVRDLENWIRTTWPRAIMARKIKRRVPDGNA
jgi:hypothetical protein